MTINKYFKSIALIAVVLFIAINIISCKDDDPIIGADILKGDKINVQFDNSAIVRGYTLSQEDDTTSNVPLGLLGNLNDSMLGYSGAGFAVQIRKPRSSDFHTHPDASTDSVRLYLSFYDVLGDSLTTQNVSVHELEGGLDLKEVYRANFDIESLIGEELGSADLNYETAKDAVVLKDTVFEKDNVGEFVLDSVGNKIIDTLIYDTLLKDQLIISLPNQFGERILKADSIELSNQDEFLQFFKGIYVKTDPLSEGGGIFSFNLIASKMVLYYNYTDTIMKNEKDTIVKENKNFAFNITENSARFNLFEHDATDSPMDEFLNNETVEDTVFYVQGMTGTRVKLEIDDINTRWNNLGDISINKAELQFFVSDTLNVPGTLKIRGLDEDGNEIELTDNKIRVADVEDNTKFYEFSDGIYNKDTESYTFNIPYHIQEIIDGETENYGFVIFSADGEINPQRVILSNPEGTDREIKLSVTYTKL